VTLLRRWSGFSIAGLALLLGPAPVSGHHSFAAEFDGKKPVTLKGKLTKLDWVNPHAWIYLDVTGEDGKVVSWAIQVASPTALVKRGLNKGDFSPGAEMVVKGYLAKNGTATIAGSIGTFPDGREFSVGSFGPGSSEPRPPQ
jgi:hypothetical protein